MSREPAGFEEPPWNAPLDPDPCIRAVPTSATMTGMFLSAVVDVAKTHGVTLPSARPRYTSFQRYPLREHCQLLVEASRLVFPDVPLRQGLRRLGRGAPQALVSSTVGRVVFGSVEGPLEIIRAMARSYAMHMTPCQLEVVREGERAAIVQMSELYNFADSHNVGVFEGVLRYADVRGSVRIRSYTRVAADVLCEW
jgi:uncharacterized protein (TIGR02265 family)